MLVVGATLLSEVFIDGSFGEALGWLREGAKGGIGGGVYSSSEAE